MRLFWLLSLLTLLFLGCNQEDQGGDPPRDHPYFPSALIQNDKILYVLSANFDRRFQRGSVLSVDLVAVDSALAASQAVVGPSAVKSSGFIPGFASGAQITSKKDGLYFVSRDDRTLRKIPLDSEGDIACTSGSEKLGQDCFSGVPALSLGQSDPYFLRLFESENLDLKGGVVGYLNEARVLNTDINGQFPIPISYELERFTWNSSLGTAEITDRLSFGESLEKAMMPSTLTGFVRVNSLLGTIETFGASHYMLVAHPGSTQPTIYLVKATQTEFEQGLPLAMQLAYFDLTRNAKISTLGAMAIREKENSIEFFVTTEAPASVVKLTMPNSDPVDANGRLKLSKVGEKFACEVPTDLKLSPDGAYLFMACNDGKVLVYDPETLSAVYRDPDFGAAFGRGTLKIHFDTRFSVEPFRFYALNFLDGSIGMFQFSGTAQTPLSRLGHIFQPAPPNRLGGSK